MYLNQVQIQKELHLVLLIILYLKIDLDPFTLGGNKTLSCFHNFSH